MPTCSAFGCTNRNDKKIEGITFHRFPKNPEKRAAWVKAVRRKDWTPSVNSFLCSAHFEPQMMDKTSLSCVRLRENAVPSIFGAPTYKKKMMADSSSDIEAIDILDADTICGKENGVLNKSVSSSDIGEKPLKAVSDLKEMDVSENSVTDNSNHAIDLSSDEDASKNSSIPEIKAGRKTSRKMKPTARNRIPPKSDGVDEISDVETVSSTSENHKDLGSNLDDDKTESDVPMDISSPIADSDKQSCKDVEMSSVKSNSIPDRLFDTSPKCSPELIVADDGPLFKMDTSESSPAPPKADGETETSENSSKAANESSSKKNSKDEEPSPKSKGEGKSEGKKEKKKGKTCPECGQKKKLNFSIVFQGKCHRLCSEICYKEFKQKLFIAIPAASPKPEVAVTENCIQCQSKIISGQGYFPLLGEIKSVCSEECLKKFHDANGPKNHCSHCKSRIESAYNQLTWETMIFCNEDCLGKYQSFLGSHCTCCQSPVQQVSLGKYCVCFGADIRQFCSGTCLDEFKKNLKVCSYCQTDLSAGTDGFLAPVGEKGQFKDFCSQSCMERYEVMNNLSKAIPETLECSHCKRQGSFKIHVKYQEKTHSLCCDLCVAGFRCSNKLQDNMCNTCFNFFKPTEKEKFWFHFEGSPKHFCTKACMTLYVLSHRKIIQCVHCKVKKYTFDMIERLDPSNQIQMFCSLNCLSLYRVNVSAASNKSIRCDHCNKSTPAQYHLTMSDGSIRNFCTYQCVLNFQNQFAAVPALTTTTTTVRPTIYPKTITKTTTTGTSPVIVSAISLANHTRPLVTTAGKGIMSPTLLVRQQAPPNVSILSPRAPTSTATMAAPVLSVANTASAPMREIVVRPPAPKSVKNKSASCKPIMQTKGVNAKLQTCHKAVQTDERPMPIILPVPVPIYVPTPMHMFSRPIACPVPFPVPLPVPVSMNVKKSTKDKQENTPSHFMEDKVELPKSVCDKATGSEEFIEATVAPTNIERVNQSKDSLQTMEKSNDKSIEVDLTNTNNAMNTADIQASSEASCSTSDKNENLNKRKLIDEEQSQSKKPKFELAPVSGLDTSNNDQQEIDFHSVKSGNSQEPNSLLNIT